jgi:hypothetical protein
MPGWCGWNALQRGNLTDGQTEGCRHIEQNNLPHKVGYLPVIDTPPTDLTTVCALMERSIETVDMVMGATNDDEQKHSVLVTCDQAVYAKALEVYYSPLHNQLERIVLRMGAFHVILNFMSVLGQRFGSAGLRDVLIESDVLANGSVDSTLDGRHYNRGIRAHKLTVEGFGRLRWAAFLQWNDAQVPKVDMESLTGAVGKVRHNLCKDALQVLLSSDIFMFAEQRFNEFITSQGLKADFWSSYIDMVELLLQFIRSTREANWRLHIQCLQEMMPWFAAYDRTHYTRYLPAYVLQMLKLPQSHPDAHALLMEGEFAVQRSRGNTFGLIPHDQMIEVTANRDTKTRWHCWDNIESWHCS